MKIVPDPTFTNKVAQLPAITKAQIKMWLERVESAPTLEDILSENRYHVISQSQNVYVARFEGFRIFFSSGKTENTDFLILLDIASHETINKVVRYDSKLEEEVVALMKRFDGQTIPGDLMCKDSDIILPKFSNIRPGIRIENYIPDIIAETKNDLWLVEIKGGIRNDDKIITMTINQIIDYRSRVSGTAWLIALSNEASLMRNYARQENILFTGPDEWLQLNSMLSLKV